MVRWEEDGGLDRLFCSPRVPALSAAGTCSHVTIPRAASSARARHSRASIWLSGCNACCRSPPFEDAWAVLAATLGDSDSALGCRDQSGAHGSDGEAPRPISHRAYQCECSRQVRGLLRPARPPVHPPSESHVPSLSARSPARPSAAGARTARGCRQGCGGRRGAEALACVAMPCHACRQCIIDLKCTCFIRERTQMDLFRDDSIDFVVP
jgi:hypothetical protein